MGCAVVAVKILADWYRYNANSRDRNTGDCVKRALTIAYRTDYNKVSSELNKIKRDLGYDKFNISPVFSRYLSARGDAFRKYGVVDPETGELNTVTKFCEEHPTGTWLLLVGKYGNQHETHMVAVVDGDYYDSWDSGDYVVYYCAEVTGVDTSMDDSESVVYDDIVSTLIDYLDGVINKWDTKSPEYIHQYLDDVRKDDEFTYELVAAMELGDLETYSPRYKSYSGRTLRRYFPVKFNPLRNDVDSIVKDLEEKLKRDMYAWYHKNIKILTADSEVAKIQVNPNFRGDETDLLKLPEWVRPLVTTFWDYGAGSSWTRNGGYRYEVFMEALPDDPRAVSTSSMYSDVGFYADTLTELKQELKRYKENFDRVGYDYDR